MTKVQRFYNEALREPGMGRNFSNFLSKPRFASDSVVKEMKPSPQERIRTGLCLLHC
jgi:hypothetical protein